VKLQTLAFKEIYIFCSYTIFQKFVQKGALHNFLKIFKNRSKKNFTTLAFSIKNWRKRHESIKLNNTEIYENDCLGEIVGMSVKFVEP